MYILARVQGDFVQLIELSSGNPWNDSMEVCNPSNILESEMKQLIGSAYGEFKRLPKED